VGDLVYDEYFKEYGIILDCYTEEKRLIVYWPSRGLATALDINAQWLTNLSLRPEKKEMLRE